MLNPITKALSELLRAGARETGKQMGKVVQKDHEHALQAIKSSVFAPYKSELQKDIVDLVLHDSEVSASWIAKLISRSNNNVEYLKSIQSYIANPVKSGNLDNSTRRELADACASKIQHIRDSALMEKLLVFLREHGDDLF
ncbi:hypothetical protein P4H66_06160 [Paenibacillus dokdonensis]|uniref:Uncharacterized protein n=1 Tax=Paenibacillus dokdonensis TaxID=2567944 RepID=A0ABU6GJR2_9BACL|nr:hypothetical protein [Paenibacillus dokdonensis]MEC0239438.1 hypothetical protein [Paenibacillus dokdonensis]